MSRRLERIFTNPSEISKHLYCSVCTDIFLDPTRLFCGHTFCKKCLTHWMSDHKTCPICRSEIHSELVSQDLVANKIIQDLEVKCSNSECTWINRLEDLENHVKECKYTKKPEWLFQNQNYIEIDDEKPLSSTISEHPVKKSKNVTRQLDCFNIFERVLSMTQETHRLLENLTTSGPLSSASSRNKSRQSNPGRLANCEVEGFVEFGAARKSKPTSNSNRMNEVVILSNNFPSNNKESLSRKKEGLNRKERKTLQNEIDFFGLKPWLEAKSPGVVAQTDRSIGVLTNSTRNKNTGSRDNRRASIDSLDDCETIVKTKKTVLI